MKVRQISHECVIGSCPIAFSAGDDLIIVGPVLTSEERKAVARKVNDGETAVRVPRSFIASLKL